MGGLPADLWDGVNGALKDAEAPQNEARKVEEQNQALGWGRAGAESNPHKTGCVCGRHREGGGRWLSLGSPGVRWGWRAHPHCLDERARPQDGRELAQADTAGE